VFAIGSSHAREYTPAETLIRWAEALIAGYGTDPDITWILDYNEIHILPHANPDGRVWDENRRDLWRKNRNSERCKNTFGVDLNRNFPFNHGYDNAGSSGNSCHETYRGTAAGSESETQAIMAYAKALFPVSQRKGANDEDRESVEYAEIHSDEAFSDENTGVFIDTHSYGDYVFYPWGFDDKVSPNNDGLGAMGRKLASWNGYKLWAPPIAQLLVFNQWRYPGYHVWLVVSSFDRIILSMPWYCLLL
jgi:hypothetical protein